jgi:hypothetical protein
MFKTFKVKTTWNQEQISDNIKEHVREAEDNGFRSSGIG